MKHPVYCFLIAIFTMCFGCGSSKKATEKMDIVKLENISQGDTTKIGHSDNRNITQSKSVVNDVDIEITKVLVALNDSGRVTNITWLNKKKKQQTKTKDNSVAKAEIKDTISVISNKKSETNIESKIDKKEEQKYSMGKIDAWIGILFIVIFLVFLIISKYKR